MGLLSIGALLILYWSSIGPLLVAVFGRPPAPGGRDEDAGPELGAKLGSLKGIVWVGVGLFVFSLASLMWPPIKAIIGSVTTSAALMLGGVALMVLPTLVVGNELLILGVVVLAVGGWFLAHRHGQLRGIVAASTGNAGTGTGEQKS
jgi:hypothetical protein